MLVWTMDDALKLTENDLVSISPKEFLLDITVDQKAYRNLMKKWHPDGNPGKDTSKAAASINAIADYQREKYSTSGIVANDGSVSFKRKDRVTPLFPYSPNSEIEVLDVDIGTLILNHSTLKAYVVATHDNAKLAADVLYNTVDLHDRLNLRRVKPEAVKELKKSIYGKSVCTSVRTCSIEYPKGYTDCDYMSLTRMMEKMAASNISYEVRCRHLGWMLSSLFSLNCMLKVVLKHSFNAITKSNILVDWVNHDMCLIYGGACSTSLGDKPKYMPRDVAALGTRNMITLDSRAIKALGLEILGDRTGMALRRTKVPKPILNFLVSSAISDPVKEYTAWKEVLKESFGPPKFIKFKGV